MGFIERLSAESEDERTLGEAKALAEYLTPSSCLKESDFGDVYSPEELAEDQTLLQKIKSRFSDYHSPKEKKAGEFAKSISSAMERIIAHHGELSDWFGPESFITKTAEYDDVINGVDFVIEFDIEDPDAIGLDDNYHKIAIAADVTSSHDQSIIDEKLRKCRERTLATNRPAMKYFDSKVEAFAKGKVDHIVHVLVGVEMKEAKQIVRDSFRLVRYEKMTTRTESQTEDMKKLRKQLESHPAQVVFLKEILVQLEYFQKEIKDNDSLKNEVGNLILIIADLIKSKEDSGITTESLESDSTYQTITSRRSSTA